MRRLALLLMLSALSLAGELIQGPFIIKVLGWED